MYSHSQVNKTEMEYVQAAPFQSDELSTDFEIWCFWKPVFYLDDYEQMKI